MSHTKANFLLLIASFIWGTAFISQAMGMDHIGPFTFSFARTFLGFLVVLPLAILFMCLLWQSYHDLSLNHQYTG